MINILKKLSKKIFDISQIYQRYVQYIRRYIRYIFDILIGLHRYIFDILIGLHRFIGSKTDILTSFYRFID